MFELYIEIVSYLIDSWKFTWPSGFFYMSTVCSHTFPLVVVNSDPLIFNFVVTLIWCVDNLTDFKVFVYYS